MLKQLAKAILFASFLIQPAWAEHPIDIERAVADEKYLEALALYDKLPQRSMTLNGHIAATKAAWALSLPDRSLALADQLLRDSALPLDNRVELNLIHAIIDLQEGRQQSAQYYAERVIELTLDKGPLAARAHALIGQTLLQTNSLIAAEKQLLQAEQEIPAAERGDVEYSLGDCRHRLGKLDAARDNLEQVPVNHTRTADAVRQLAEIALTTAQYDDAAFWLKKGRREHADRFLDSWVDYALTQVAIQQNDLDTVRNVRLNAEKTYPASDPWLVILQSAAEAYEWSQPKQALNNIGVATQGGA